MLRFSYRWRITSRPEIPRGEIEAPAVAATSRASTSPGPVALCLAGLKRDGYVAGPAFGGIHETERNVPLTRVGAVKVSRGVDPCLPRAVVAGLDQGLVAALVEEGV